MPRTPRTPLQEVLRLEGRSQRWLAEQVGMHESDLSRIATGRQVPTEHEAEAIAKALGRESADLFEHTLPRAA